MTNINIIENKISSVEKYLKILERYKKHSKEEIEDSIDIKGAVERYLYLLLQSTIDLAESFVSYKNFRKPSTLSDSFYILNENKIISNEMVKDLIKMTGFRNAIAHDYEKINYEIVYDVLQNKTKEIVEFINVIEKEI